MPTDSDDPKHRYHNTRTRVKDSDLPERDRNAVLVFLAALDRGDMSHSYINDKGEQETLSYNTLVEYGRCLRQIGAGIESDLLDATIDELRSCFDRMADNVANQTVRQRQAAARKFYRYHETGIEATEIPLISTNSNSDLDERTTLSQEDIEAIRDACDNLRDRAMIELFIYTGQRLRAIQTLRIKDIDLNESVYYLNTDEAGLKNADEIGGKRPLLGAEKPVRQWIENHPTGNPDDYLITTLPSAGGTNGPGEYLSKIGFYNRLAVLFDRADVDKPDGQMAHAFRHYFVTVCYRDYDMDPTTIKHLIGHAKGSTVMETTYQHLTDQDHVDAARQARNVKDNDSDDEETALTPEKCPTCNEPLSPTAKACPDCGMVFTPDAQSAQSRVETAIPEIQNETEAQIVSNVLENVRENPDDYLK